MKSMLKKSIMIFIAACSLTVKGQMTVHLVLPSTTDAAITQYTDASTFEYHVCAVNLSVTPRNLLFVFLPGTGGMPLAYKRIDSTAANLGFHVIGLMYPNSPSIGSLCDANSDTTCFDNTRREIIDGIDRSTLVTVDTTNCIINRLEKILRYLKQHYPGENWAQYLDVNNNILWDKIVISGHSQGGGHAGIIAKYYHVNRVVYFASPKDFNRYYNRQAAWYGSNNATPSSVYYGFSHSSDSTGNTPIEQIACYNLFGMGVYGPVVNVDTSASPYNNSHILTSSLATTNAHGCVVVDNAVGLNNGVPVYKPVWIYMLTDVVSTNIHEIPNCYSLLKIYPNPATNEIMVETFQKSEIEIINIEGQIIKTFSNVEKVTPIDLTNLSGGVYLIKAKSVNGVAIGRFIKEE